MNMEHPTVFTKIVRSDVGPTLFGRTIEDMKMESWGVQSARPLVYLANAHEAVEKSLWCYLNNMVPLIGERDPDLTARLAAMYGIDSIIADVPSLKLLFSRFFPHHGQIVAISLLGGSFDETEYAPFRAHTSRFRLVQTDENGSTMVLNEL